MKRTLYTVFCILQLLTIVLSYDPATCIKCRESHMCNPPDCFCCRDEMPLEKRKIPQMVFFTFDDAVTPQVAGYYKELFDSKRKNPNGCPISMTLFISHSNTVYRLVREFYDKGMEIASHSVTHGHPNPETFLREAKKQRENLAKKTKIPEKDIVGWRSPFLEPLGDTQPSVLKQLGYEYDATLTVTKKSSTDKAVIPFTLDYGWPYDCKIKSCPTKSHKGFWEVPVVSVKDYLNKYDCVYVDGCNNPPPSENLAFKFLWDNFQRYYTTNRAPMGINMHASWFYYPKRKAAMDRFIKELVKLDDVYIISVKQVIAWLKQPTSLQNIKTFQPWQCNGNRNASSNVVINKSNVPNRTSVNNNNGNLSQLNPQNINRAQLFQKMAEQRNQWRRRQIQRERHIMSTFQNRPVVPSIQPATSVHSSIPPNMIRGPGPIPPMRPAIPPLVPNHPMINFWWQPPPAVLPPEIQHELEIRRNIQMQQQRQEVLNRQRLERERQMQLEARRRSHEQQSLHMMRQKQEDERKRQQFLKQQDDQRLHRQLELKKNEEKKRQELERRKLAENLRHQEAMKKLALERGHTHQEKQNAKPIESKSNNSVNTPENVIDSGILVEYLPSDLPVNNQPIIQHIDLAIHRPPLREAHGPKMIKEKLKLTPGNLKTENFQSAKELSIVLMQSSVATNDSIRNKKTFEGIPNTRDEYLLIKDQTNAPTIQELLTQATSTITPTQSVSKTSDQLIGNIDNTDNLSRNSSTNVSGMPPMNSVILDNILNYKPTERVKYLHELSLEELKSLQSELRRRLESGDPTTVNKTKSTPADISAQRSDIVRDTIKQNVTPMQHTTETSINKFKSDMFIEKSQLQSLDIPNEGNAQRASLTISIPSFSKRPAVKMDNGASQDFVHTTSDPITAPTVPKTTTTITTRTPPITTSTTTTTHRTTTSSPITTTLRTEVSTDLTNIYNAVTDKITEYLVFSTPVTAPVETSTTELKTMPAQPIVSTEPTLPQLTSRPHVKELGGKSLWQIGDIFDMSQHIHGGKTTAPVIPVRPKSNKVLTVLPTESKSLNLFAFGGHQRPNDAFVSHGKEIKVNEHVNQDVLNHKDESNKPKVILKDQAPTSASKLVSMPAKYSKSLFIVNGYADSNPFIPTGVNKNNGHNRVSLHIPQVGPTEMARLTIGSPDKSGGHRQSQAVNYDISTDVQTTPTTITPESFTTTTMAYKKSLPKKMVNRAFQQLIKPVDLFQNNFESLLGKSQAGVGLIDNNDANSIGSVSSGQIPDTITSVQIKTQLVNTPDVFIKSNDTGGLGTVTNGLKHDSIINVQDTNQLINKPDVLIHHNDTSNVGTVSNGQIADSITNVQDNNQLINKPVVLIHHTGTSTLSPISNGPIPDSITSVQRNSRLVNKTDALMHHNVSSNLGTVSRGPKPDIITNVKNNSRLVNKPDVALQHNVSSNVGTVSNGQKPDIITNGQDKSQLINEHDFLIPLPGSIRTPGSKCQQEVNCFSPDCICKTETTPNNLPASQIPQIVYITVDGSMNFHTYSKIRQLFGPKRVNPNGCRIKGTLFVTDAGSNYRIADLLHAKGLELGLSGLSTRPPTSAADLENSIITLTEQITSRTKVSPIAIKGWRTPGFKPIGDTQYEILSNYSLYDSSLVADRSGGRSKLWPFTLDFGWKEDCSGRPCPSGFHPGVMEVPIMPFSGPGNSTACEYTDGCAKQPESEQQTLDYLMKNFNDYYKTNRAPFAIRLKQIWFHWYYRSNLRGLIKFLDTILGYKDVYVTSMSDMLDWVKDPTALTHLDTFQPWLC